MLSQCLFNEVENICKQFYLVMKWELLILRSLMKNYLHFVKIVCILVRQGIMSTLFLKLFVLLYETLP
jgi:hypothetical protein